MTDRDDVLSLLRDRFDALDQRMDSQDETLAGIHSEAKRTNGRVSALEEHIERRTRIWRFIWKALGAVFVSSCAGIGLELTRLFT